jgi:hypothetical protein
LAQVIRFSHFSHCFSRKFSSDFYLSTVVKKKTPYGIGINTDDHLALSIDQFLAGGWG